MPNKNRQRGMTMWGLLFVLGVLAFFLFLTFKLAPPYLQDFKVRAAMDGLIRTSDAGRMSKAEMVEALQKRFDIDDVNDVDPRRLQVEMRGRVKVIRLQYERVIPLALNVSALIEFDHVREVAASE